MSNLQSLLLTAKEGLAIGQSIPQTRSPAIAAKCGPTEVAEIHIRIAKLRAELEAVEEWDGETQDDIHVAIDFFTQLAALCSQ
ncbi:hypothetical protein KIK84_08495 [Curvibacter sp. CHRR-16]|uniref:hypothetical protein n=1 Tax=Curvibacter sp. CHRR-16 TaxID=2835872 RepID=UPI001BDAA847|nr:hypothetical protein [Curvibacter sp. CHRR-16]MBT0570364.1 hypothetical protein [Curvibacter sp. CHRR-16]